ncbi:hypothetical protein Catovirus_1_104 [Catovirus CTV1]|uniref:Uncharacterized protein n=1 Tax=Catovirus CTV1 TaxID=1977631 RepID=A0A1V0S8M0_9VIRU|nr:hypothetical protein Catovirus_1_104 [Catovirus CTV1]
MKKILINKAENDCTGKLTSTPQKNSESLIIPKEKIFVQLNEKFNYKKCLEFLLSGFLDTTYYNSILKYLSYSKHHGKNEEHYSCKVSYLYPDNGIGRFKTCVFKKVKDKSGKTIEVPTSCSTQTNMWNELKSYILNDIYYDVDIVNCQPSILEHILVKNKLSTKYINIYNNNRESYFQEIINTFNYSRKEAKTLIISIMFGGRVDQQIYDKLPENVKNYINEVKTNTIELLKIYPQYLEESKRIKEINGKKYNYEGSALALLLQTEERKALECMYEFFTDKGFVVACLLCDGIHLEKKKTVTKKVLDDCSKYILDKLDYNLKITIKDFKKINLNNITVCRNFDPLTTNRNDITVTNFDCDKICPINGDPFSNVNLFKDNGKLKDILLIKAKTGDGKTYFAKQVRNFIKNNKEILKKYIKIQNKFKDYNKRTVNPADIADYTYEIKEPNYNIKFLSIVSRISLANSHEIEFDLINYQHTMYHGLDEVYQLDSIDKFINLNNDYYVLFLDEIASLCSHFLNNMDKMRMNRNRMVDIFKKILNDPKCIQIIGCDDNLNDGTISFIKNLTKKSIYLYVNNKVNRFEQPVNIYSNLSYTVKRMKEDIRKGIKIFCCSNKNMKFFQTVVRPVIDELKLKENEYIIYSGDYGKILNQPYNDNDSDDPDIVHDFSHRIITADWNKPDIKIIFCTPSILYGVSYDEKYTHSVYGYYFANSPLNAMDCNQQINRPRVPREINLFIEKQICRPFKDLDTCCNHILENVFDNHFKWTEFRECCAINELYIFDHYVKSHFSDIFYYLPYLLKKKGYVNINVIVKPREKQLAYTTKKYNEILVTEYKNGILDVKKMDSVNVYLKSFGFSKKFIDSNPKLDKIEKKIRDNVLDVFTNNKYTRCLELFKKTVDRTFESSLEISDDTKLLKLYSDDYKIKLLDDLHKLLKIKWFDTDLLNKLKSKGENVLNPFDFPKELCDGICHPSRFNVRAKDKPKNYIDSVIFLLKRYTMFSADLIVNKSQNLSVSKNKQQYQFSVPQFGELLNKLNIIVEYDKQIMKLKLEYDKQKLNDKDDYLF